MTEAEVARLVSYLLGAVCLGLLLDALIWRGLWRDEMRWQYISSDSKDFCRSRYLTSTARAIVAGVVGLFFYYYGVCYE